MVTQQCRQQSTSLRIANQQNSRTKTLSISWRMRQCLCYPLQTKYIYKYIYICIYKYSLHIFCERTQNIILSIWGRFTHIYKDICMYVYICMCMYIYNYTVVVTIFLHQSLYNTLAQSTSTNQSNPFQILTKLQKINKWLVKPKVSNNCWLPKRRPLKRYVSTYIYIYIYVVSFSLYPYRQAWLFFIFILIDPIFYYYYYRYKKLERKKLVD